MTVPAPAHIRAAKRYGREGYVQDCLAALMVGDRPPKWNTPSQPTARGAELLRRCAGAALPKHSLPSGNQLTFFNEFELPAIDPGQPSGWPDYAVTWAGQLLLVELKTEPGSHRSGQMRYYHELAAAHHPDRHRTLVYVTPELDERKSLDPVPVVHVHWDHVIDWILDIWSGAPRDETEMAGHLAAMLRFDEPWSRDAPAGGTATTQVAADPQIDSEVGAAARAVAADGQQRAIDIVWGSANDLERCREILRTVIQAEHLPVVPWLWKAASSGGRPISASGAELGYELRVSRQARERADGRPSGRA